MERRPRRRVSRRPPAGADPSALAHRPRERKEQLRLVHYDEAHYEERLLDDVGDLGAWLPRPGVLWLHLFSPTEEELAALRSLFALHPIAVSNVAHVPQRPQWQSFAEHDALLLQDLVSPTFETDQVSILVGESWVLCFEERRPDSFEGVRERLREGVGSIRAYDAGRLAASLAASVVDAFYPHVEQLHDEVDALEDRLLAARPRVELAELQLQRRRIVHLRHAVWPMRDALGQAARDETPRFHAEARLLLREAAHDVEQVVEMLEAAQASASALSDLHANVVGARTNEIVGLLTVVSTLFLPMTFLAGVWGMNFDTRLPGNMPELEWPYGYALAWAAMLLSAGGILGFLRRRGWLPLGRRAAPRRRPPRQ